MIGAMAMNATGLIHPLPEDRPESGVSRGGSGVAAEGMRATCGQAEVPGDEVPDNGAEQARESTAA